MEKTLLLAGIFSDGMVLQRDAVNKILGTDSLADEVVILFDGNKIICKTSAGRFSVELPARGAGTGFSIVVKGSETIEIKDVSFGDVFMLSGQSNMELPVGRVLDVSGDEVAAADYPDICQYRLTPEFVFGENEYSSLPASKWTKAVKGEIMEMSAAGFFFAKRIREEIGVPIGLILNAQGGASIEAWMPMSELDAFGNFSKEIEPFLEKGSLTDFLTEREKRIYKWYESVDAGVGAIYSKEVPEGAKIITLPAMFNSEEKDGFSGSIWFYKEVFLESDPGVNGFLYAGELIDSDKTYINGVQVGETAYRYPPRKYCFDASLLHAGKNLIAIRLVIENHFGGFIPEHPYYLEASNKHIELTGDWFYVIEKEAEYDIEESFMAQKLPSGLFRASILPLFGLSMKGILWYQGETNSGAPDRYDEKFSAMISCWREHLAQDLPVVCVEMADYHDPVTGTSDGWSEIQKMQRGAPDSTTLCEVVSAKDLGAPFELHPQYKSQLGGRLAEKVLDFLYHR
jgi:sialate O-acetylesterase